MNRIALAHGAWIDYDEAFLPAAQADALLTNLRAELVWEQREIVLFGRRVLQPRLIAWAGELGYRYSGQTLEPRAWGAALEAVREAASACAGVAFNHALVNRYRDGQDSMGLHADAEPELGDHPVVATLSLGATRRFVVQPRDRTADRRVFPLTHGALLIMGGTCQEHHRHGVPRDASVTGERISVTFRRLLAAPRG